MDFELCYKAISRVISCGDRNTTGLIISSKTQTSTEDSKCARRDCRFQLRHKQKFKLGYQSERSFCYGEKAWKPQIFAKPEEGAR